MSYEDILSLSILIFLCSCADFHSLYSSLVFLFYFYLDNNYIQYNDFFFSV